MSELEQQKISESPEKELPGKKKKNKKVKEKRPLWQEILSWVLTLLCAFAAAMVIRSVIFEPVRVDGESMDDTLADKEIMLCIQQHTDAIAKLNSMNEKLVERYSPHQYILLLQ